MDAPATITALFPGNRTEVFSALTLKEVAKQLQQRNYTAAQEPLLLTIAGNQESLYYDSDAFAIYLNDPEGWQQLFGRTWCEGLYRNVIELVDGKEIIDTGSLWMLRKDELILIDSDRHVKTLFNESLFNTVQ